MLLRIYSCAILTVLVQGSREHQENDDIWDSDKCPLQKDGRRYFTLDNKTREEIPLCAWVFEHAACDGKKIPLMSPQSIPDIKAEWDNVITAVYLSDGCQFKGYEDKNFMGNGVLLKQVGYHHVEDLNDKISSLKCYCGEDIPGRTNITGKISFLMMLMIPFALISILIVILIKKKPQLEGLIRRIPFLKKKKAEPSSFSYANDSGNNGIVNPVY